MAVKQTAGREALGEFAPKFAELNDDVLFGQVWSREDKLSLRAESTVLECIRIAHETNMEVVKFINTIVETIGKPKFTFEKAAVNHDLLDDLCAYGMNQIEYALDTDDKNVREERLTAARRDFADKFAEKYEDFVPAPRGSRRCAL